MTANARVERWLFAGCALAVFAYVLARALLVPLVHDEATSFLAYMQPGRFLPFASMWDANDHYLNSALGALGYRALGLHLLALRWGSVLAYLLYAWASYHLGRAVRHTAVRWVLWVALLTCPFALDFFSLSRGYGPAMALVLVSVLGALRFARTGARGALVQALLAMAAANACVLSMLPLWAVLLALLLPACWRTRPLLGRWTLLGAVPLACAALLAYRMAQLGLLYHGDTTGFVSTTLGSLLHAGYGIRSAIAEWLVFGMLAVLGLFMVLPNTRERNVASPPLILGALLWGEVLCRVVLAHIAHLNYAEDRTALHTLLLAILFVAWCADALAERHRLALLIALPLLLFPARTLLTLNTDHTILWKEQAVPDRFAQRVAAMERERGRPLVVGAHRLLGLSWSLQRRMLGSEGDVNAVSWPHGTHEVRIVDERVPATALRDYAVVDSAPAAGLRLLVRTPPLRTALLVDTATTLRTDTATRQALYTTDATALRTHDLFVEVEGTITSAVEPLDLRVCVAVYDTAGRPLHNDFLFLATRRAHWQGDAFHTIRPVPQHALASRLEVWVWDPQQAAYQLAPGRIRVHRVMR